jgi:hypothetical protein
MSPAALSPNNAIENKNRLERAKGCELLLGNSLQIQRPEGTFFS